MDLAHEVGAALVQDLGAVLVALVVAVDVKRTRLHLRAHRAVAQQHPVGEVIEDVGHLGSEIGCRGAGADRFLAAHADHVADGDDEVGAV